VLREGHLFRKKKKKKIPPNQQGPGEVQTESGTDKKGRESRGERHKKKEKSILRPEGADVLWGKVRTRKGERIGRKGEEETRGPRCCGSLRGKSLTTRESSYPRGSIVRHERKKRGIEKVPGETLKSEGDRV